ncbi:NAD-dependent epimerase/dehydratase family protein [Novosphingobium sp. KCTC 2891]|uniref:NAD-dependent epimerase/dehydratase family protein n=1 Tax=Novosphingobium sp. KCTC 2891 TaxID=2989730 RepID=UPI002223C9A5|nr:NAD-dependent epimerase/dehydratase family protein [Novosphingobium sp. KCTC 2891]MCW1383601.1 NAD-dependent epimerase/dehydratase family protein [Novosphingobium sp. KCTC 2891]
MKLLVMGGNRYIGLQLVHELVEQGHDVTVLNSHEASLPPGVHRLHGQRHDPGTLERLLLPLRDSFDAVFDNTAYTPDHLEPMIEIFRGRVQHFIFTSSIAVYEMAAAQPIDEGCLVGRDADTALYGAYAAGKVHCEERLAREHAANGFPFTALRVTHSCGPMSPAVTREPGTFMRLELGRPLLIAGKVEAMVHFIHTRDVARALVAVLGKPHTAGQIYNVAGKQFSSIVNYMRLMAAAVGVEPEIVMMPDDLPAHMRSPIVHWLEASRGSMVFSIEKAKADLNWEPKFSLAEALADSYAWFRNGGREKYEYDFSQDDEILAEIARHGGVSASDGPDRTVFRAQLDTLRNM